MDHGFVFRESGCDSLLELDLFSIDGYSLAGDHHIPTNDKRVGDAARAARAANIARARAVYEAAPNRCPQCDDPIAWKSRKRKECCGRICAGYRMRGQPFSKKNPRVCPRCSRF